MITLKNNLTNFVYGFVFSTLLLFSFYKSFSLFFIMIFALFLFLLSPAFLLGSVFPLFFLTYSFNSFFPQEPLIAIYFIFFGLVIFKKIVIEKKYFIQNNPRNIFMLFEEFLLIFLLSLPFKNNINYSFLFVIFLLYSLTYRVFSDTDNEDLIKGSIFFTALVLVIYFILSVTLKNYNYSLFLSLIHFFKNNLYNILVLLSPFLFFLYLQKNKKYLFSVTLILLLVVSFIFYLQKITIIPSAFYAYIIMITIIFFIRILGIRLKEIVRVKNINTQLIKVNFSLFYIAVLAYAALSGLSLVTVFGYFYINFFYHSI